MTEAYNIQEHIRSLKEAELKPLLDLIKKHEAETQKWREMFLRLAKEGSYMIVGEYGHVCAAEALTALALDILDDQEREKVVRFEKALEREKQKLDDLVKQAHAAIETKNGN